MLSKTISRASSMTKSHINNVMQIMIFRLGDGEHYGINVSKIRSIEDYKRYPISKNEIQFSEQNHILEGYINYHKNIIPMLNIEKWLGMYQESNSYLETIVCEFNRKVVAFPISDIENIFNVSIDTLQESESNNKFITYSTIVKIADEEIVCRVIDVEQLLVDVFGEDDTTKTADKKGFSSKKLLLVADDSRVARATIEEILEETHLDYMFFEDGAKIITYLDTLSPKEVEEIGLVVTDLEMPHKDGYQVITHIHEAEKLHDIPVAVNSSMSDKGVVNKTEKLGSSGFVGKTDPENLLKVIRKNMRG